MAVVQIVSVFIYHIYNNADVTVQEFTHIEDALTFTIEYYYNKNRMGQGS